MSTLGCSSFTNFCCDLFMQVFHTLFGSMDRCDCCPIIFISTCDWHYLNKLSLKDNSLSWDMLICCCFDAPGSCAAACKPLQQGFPLLTPWHSPFSISAYLFCHWWLLGCLLMVPPSRRVWWIRDGIGWAWDGFGQTRTQPANNMASKNPNLCGFCFEISKYILLTI